MQMFYYSYSTTQELKANDIITGSVMYYYSYKEPASLFYGV